jgi:hypothetical protein
MGDSRYLVPLQVAILALLTFYQLFHLPESSSSSVTVISSETLDIPLIPCSNHAVQAPRQQQQQGEVSIKNSFGACLIIMDDNHFLAEWLAYHHHVLPLRRLIVGIDPRSRTSPKEILDRYRNRGLMKITEWHEEDFMPPHLLHMHASVKEGDTFGLKDLYIERQFQFYTKCMAILKHENVTWTAITDTDEYVLRNPHAEDHYRLKDNEHENKTIYDLIQSNRRIHPMIKSGCISMHRLQFGFKESDVPKVQNMVPEGYNGSDFLTLRWRYHAGLTNKEFNKVAKCLVDLSRARSNDFIPTEVNAHRPIKRICSEKNLRIETRQAPFVAYHYTGSWEQWDYRNDFRPKRQREKFDKLFFDESQDDGIRPWLESFVDRHGKELASYLLEGAGRFTPQGSEHLYSVG